MVKKETQKSRNPFVLLLGILGLILPVLLFLRFYELYTGTGIPMFVPKPWYIADKIVIYKAGVLSFIGAALVLFFFVKTIKTVGKKSLKNAFITFFIGLITYLSIFIVAPSYTFQTYPRVFLYTDIKGEYIKYPNYYFWLVEKMGFYWQTFRPILSISQINDCFRFSEDHKLYNLLYSCINDAEKFGYENLFSIIQPRSFYILFLLKILDSLNFSNNHFFEDNEKKIGTYISLIYDQEIKNIYLNFINDYNSQRNKELDYNKEMQSILKKYSDILNETLKNN